MACEAGSLMARSFRRFPPRPHKAPPGPKRKRSRPRKPHNHIESLWRSAREARPIIMPDSSAIPAPSIAVEPAHAAPSGRKAFLALALGSAGVVYGDIGTSPLYAFQKSIAHLVRAGHPTAASDVIGVLSLMLWTLVVIVTIKYVGVLMRFDNRGEGGTLSLMALVQKAGGRAAGLIIAIGMIGAGMFFGDAVLTPAISVLSAVEGLEVVNGLQGHIEPFVVPLALVILVALFVIQRRGPGGLGRWFGPICVVWFLVIAALGAVAILRTPQVLAAINPLPGLALLGRHPVIAPALLGSVFLTVTGAEALYADMGHFGREPIRLAWLGLVFPCLILNYLGQGALVLAQPAAVDNPFFRLAPNWFQLPL